MIIFQYTIILATIQLGISASVYSIAIAFRFPETSTELTVTTSWCTREAGREIPARLSNEQIRGSISYSERRKKQSAQAARPARGVSRHPGRHVPICAMCRGFIDVSWSLLPAPLSMSAAGSSSISGPTPAHAAIESHSCFPMPVLGDETVMQPGAAVATSLK